MKAVPAAGAEVRSANVTNDAFVLVLGLQIDEGADLATADAVEVEYSVDGSEYLYRINRSIELGLDGHYRDVGHC